MTWVSERTAVDVDCQLAAVLGDAHDAGKLWRYVEYEEHDVG